MMLMTPLTAFAAPDGAAGSANHFDAVDVLDQRVLHLPIHAGEQGRVDGAAVDQDQHGPGQASLESADSDGPFGGIDLRHFHAGHQPQKIGDIGRARAPDILLGENGDRGRGFKRGGRLFRNRGHLDLGQLFQA